MSVYKFAFVSTRYFANAQYDTSSRHPELAEGSSEAYSILNVSIVRRSTLTLRQAQGDGINLQYKNGRSKPLPYVKFAGLNKVCPHLSLFSFPRDISLLLG